jgi:hypothetical protein
MGRQCARPGAARATGPGRPGRGAQRLSANCQRWRLGLGERPGQLEVGVTVTSLPVARHGPARGRLRGRPAGGHRGTSSSGSEAAGELQVAGQLWISRSPSAYASGVEAPGPLEASKVKPEELPPVNIVTALSSGSIFFSAQATAQSCQLRNLKVRRSNFEARALKQDEESGHFKVGNPACQDSSLR